VKVSCVGTEWRRRGGRDGAVGGASSNRITFADLDPPAPRRSSSARATTASPRPRSTRATATRSGLRETGADAMLNAADRASTRRSEAAFEHGCTYLDMAMTLSAPGALLGQEQFDAHERCGTRAARARRDRGRAWSRRSRATAITSTRSTRSRRDGPDLEPSDFAPTARSDDDRGVPEPPIVGARARVLHDRALFRAGAVRVPEGIGGRGVVEKRSCSYRA
jgi:hypothetical protein